MQENDCIRCEDEHTSVTKEPCKSCITGSRFRELKDPRIASLGAELESARKDRRIAWDDANRAEAQLKEALDVLAELFSEWENGTDCHESPDEESIYLGRACRLSDDLLKRIGSALDSHIGGRD